MMKRIELVIGERIPLTKGGFSELVYLGESSNNTRRSIIAQCSCGFQWTIQLNDVRTGHTKSCAKCGHVTTGEKLRDTKIGKLFGRLLVLYIDGKTKCGKHLTYTCRCSCGKNIEKIQGGHLSSGHTQSCGCYKSEMASKTNGSNFVIGTCIGNFLILEKLESKRRQQYRVLNQKTGNVCKMKAGQIKLLVDPLKYFRWLLRARVREALKRKNIHKTKSCIKDLPWTVEDIMTYIGPRPEGDYHLEHICPISQAVTEDEVLALNNPINLKWLPAIENISKNDSWTQEGARLCKELLGREWKDPSE